MISEGLHRRLNRRWAFAVLFSSFCLLYSVFCILPATALDADARYDSFQWYRQALYHFEQRNNPAEATQALRLALTLDPDNFDARGMALYLSRRRGMNLEDVLKLEPVKERSTNPKAGRWLGNAEDAFKNGDYQRAVHCLEQARIVDPSWGAVAILERRVRQEMAYQNARHHFEEQKYMPAMVGEKTTEEFAGFNEKLVQAILKADVAWNPKKSAEWLGLARYHLTTRNDPDRAERLARVAEKYQPDSPAVQNFFKAIETERSRRREEAEKEEKKRQEEEAAAEKERLEKEQLARSVAVTETMITPTGNEVRTGRNEFFDIPFWLETREIETGIKVQEIRLGELTRSDRPDAESVRRYIRERFAAGEEKYARGLHQEALLEYEKAYLRGLTYNPDDLRALYHLVLIYNKLAERRAALDRFMQLLKLVRSRRYRDTRDAEFRKIADAVQCWLVEAVIQAGYLGYNHSGREPLSRQTFTVGRLIRTGFLKSSDRARIVRVKLSGNVDEEQEVDFAFSGPVCPLRGRYTLNQGLQVQCSQHGVSPLVTDRYEFDKFTR